MASVPSAKLRDLNRLKSTMGCFSVSSQMSQAAKPTTVTMSRARVKGEWNQSRSLPLSSMICSAPTHTNSSARPIRSMGIFRVGVSCDFKLFQHIQAQNTPTGTRSEEHTSELQSHSDLHSFPTRRSSDLQQREADPVDGDFPCRGLLRLQIVPTHPGAEHANGH